MDATVAVINEIDTTQSQQFIIRKVANSLLEYFSLRSIGSSENCLRDASEDIDTAILKWHLLRNSCPKNIKKNLSTKTCDSSKRGIGGWAIGSTMSGVSGVSCEVFKVSYSSLPPPYGEFVAGEFVENEITEVIT